MTQYLELLHWRSCTFSLYEQLRSRPSTAATAAWFRHERNRLFRDHPQSPLPADARSEFRSLEYWPFDSRGRVEAQFASSSSVLGGQPSMSGEARLLTLGTLTFDLFGQTCRLNALWLDAYGGGLFVPFRDLTSGSESYGGGRYLVDSVKGAYLGSNSSSSVVLLDFNYAYHPSCAYDPIWPCPLAPPENHLPLAVRLGERLAADTGVMT
ncbi:MAG: DUF1684 domain-containing protein [Chloroflexota bacterium]